jgi:hypothetical protein
MEWADFDNPHIQALQSPSALLYARHRDSDP